MDVRWNFSNFTGKRILLGICGSVSAYKAVELMRLLQEAGIGVSITLTESAQRFITPLTFASLGAENVYTSMFSGVDGDIFNHLTPGAEADLFVIAPASATTLGRLANGLASEILSAQCLAFSGKLVLAPAMNPRMWLHPATQKNISTLVERGAYLVPPAKGMVACGEEGQGKLAAVEDIFLHVLRALTPQDLIGKRVMLTIGPTREPWDGVRFWSNPSTGIMGSALALAAWLRGAEVHAIVGSGVKKLPEGINTYPVQTAKQMYERAKALWPSMHMGLFTAAVADFSPVSYGTEKFKKSAQKAPLQIEFQANKDILAELGQTKQTQQRILGFAAETNNLEEQVGKKLLAKNADMLAGNYVGQENTGFGSSTNAMYVLDKNGRAEHWALSSKSDLAWRLLDWLLTL